MIKFIKWLLIQREPMPGKELLRLNMYRAYGVREWW